MKRRAFLTTAGTVAAIGAAGCFQDGDTATREPTDETSTATATSTDTSTPTVTSTPPPQRPRELIVAAGETYRIPAGETETYETVDLDGVLTVSGTLTLTRGR